MGSQIATNGPGTTSISSSASIQGSFKVTVTWAGTGTMPTDKYVRLYSFAKGQWVGGSGTHFADEGLNGETATFSNPARVESEGVSFKKITSSPMVMQVAANAGGTVIGDPSSVGGNLELQAVVVTRAVETSLLSPTATYSHNGAFSPVLNGEDPLTGVQYDDIGISGSPIGTDSAGHPIYEYDWQYEMLGVAAGVGWVLPLTSFSWSGHPGNWNLTSTNKAQGYSTTQRKQGTPKINDGRAKAMYSAPETYRIQAIATDSVGTEYGKHVVRLHAPVQSAGMDWRGNYSCDLSLAPGIATEFQRCQIFTYRNPYSEPFAITATVNSQKTYSFGLSQTLTVSGGAEVQVVSLNFGFSYTVNITTQYSEGMTISANYVIPGNSTLVIYLYPSGTVKYPQVTRWGTSGYTGVADIAISGYSSFGLTHEYVPNG